MIKHTYEFPNIGYDAEKQLILLAKFIKILGKKHLVESINIDYSGIVLKTMVDEDLK
jgi:hypothetical protein